MGQGSGRVLVASCLCAAFVSCAAAPSSPWRPPNHQVWVALQQGLEAERARRPREPWAAGVRMTMHDPRTGRVVDGRGAIAVEPGHAVRMVFVGAAGATILDAWVTGGRWRVAVPPLDVVRRGGVDEPQDLPIGFLRWWFITPLGGVLFGGRVMAPSVLWLLRDGAAVVEVRASVCDRGNLITATRRVRGQDERVDECRALASPQPGDWVRYANDATGLSVDLSIESVSGSPSDAAFSDPDADGGGA
jgi:hypothetical protein